MIGADRDRNMFLVGRRDLVHGGWRGDENLFDQN